MSPRFTLFRLRADWGRVLLALVCAAVFYLWAGWSNTAPAAKFPYFEVVYGSRSVADAAEELEVEEAGEDVTLRQVFDAFILKNRDMLYAQVVDGSEFTGSFPCACALSILLLTSLFRAHRVGAWLAAGYSRGRVFLSLTLVYYGAVFLTWLLASRLVMAAYRVAFTPEEAYFCRTTRLAWLLSFLFRASVLYMAAFLLRRPLPAAAAGLGVCLLLLLLKPVLPFLPLHIIPTVQSWAPGKGWGPGADLGNIITGNYIALGVFLASIPAGWLSFRKRGLD